MYLPWINWILLWDYFQKIHRKIGIHVIKGNWTYQCGMSLSFSQRSEFLQVSVPFCCLKPRYSQSNSYRFINKCIKGRVLLFSIWFVSIYLSLVVFGFLILPSDPIRSFTIYLDALCWVFAGLYILHWQQGVTFYKSSWKD